MLQSTIKEYKLNYTLNRIPTKLTDDQKIIYNFLDESFNDSNSSKMREDVTNYLSNREHSDGKHGYDHDHLNIEIKPQNYTGKSKLNAGGGFSDFTWKRHRKYLDDNVTMSLSGFDNGKVLYILEIPYKILADRIEEQLIARLPNGDLPNNYVRSASINFKHYSESDIKVVFVSPNIRSHKHAMVKKLFDFLTKKGEN